MTSLRELPIGKTATIRSVGGEGALRQHFLDMGLIPKGEVTMVKYAPMGDPMELRIHSYELTLRLADAEKIEIENIRDAVEPSEGKAAHKKDISKAIPHPGLGEGGKYHIKENEHPLPDSEILTFALAGNQNCGKTTLFNQLTGSSQLSGNGTAFVEIDGHAVEYDLSAGQEILISTGYLAAMEETCTMDVVAVKGVKNMLIGGEGIFNTVVKGPGKVILQTMPISKVAELLTPFLQIRSN